MTLRRSTTTMLAALAAAAIGLLPVSGLDAQTVDAKLSGLTDPSKDVDIEADSMEVLDAAKKAIFTGRVNATRGGTTMTSERMEVSYASAPSANTTNKAEVTMLNASGGVTINTGRQVITGKAALLDVKGNVLTVTGSVTVKDGATVVRGEKLRIDLNTKVSSMTGGRVRGSFVPSAASK